MKTRIDSDETPYSIPQSVEQHSIPLINQLNTQKYQLQVIQLNQKEELDKIQKQIQTTNKQINDLHRKINNVKYSEVKTIEVDWKTLLMENLGPNNFKLMRDTWKEMWPFDSLSINSYRLQTDQYCIKFQLTKSDCTTEYLQAMAKILVFMIPFLIPFDGYVLFPITEPGLSEFTKYQIRLYGNTWKVMEGRRSQNEILSTTDIMILLNYLVKNLSFTYQD